MALFSSACAPAEQVGGAELLRPRARPCVRGHMPPAPAPTDAVDRRTQMVTTSLAIASYACSSVGMMLVNKAAVRALPFPYFLCLMQNLSTLGVAALVGFKIAPKHAQFGLRLQVTRAVLFTWLPALLLFVAMVISARRHGPQRLAAAAGR
jgi:hypothetical protein